MQTHDTLISILILLFIAIIVSIGVRRVKLPYSIGLVIAGFGLGYTQLFPRLEIDPSLIIYIFLPALLFDAGFNASITNLKQHWKVIFALAVPGTIVSILVVGAMAHYIMDIPWMSSLLFAALIVPTDTISILSVFKEMKIPAKLTSLVEGESLFNDGTAIIIFKLILSLILAEDYSLKEINYGGFTLSLFLSYAGGLLLGIAGGYGAGWLMKKVKDHLVEIMFTVMVIYGIFLLAEELSVSSIVAVVTTSLMLGNYRQRMAISATTQIALSSFWSFAAFALNSVLFIIIGLQVNFSLLLDNFWIILIALIAVNIGRIAFIYPFSFLVNIFEKRKLKDLPDEIPIKWQHVLVLGNLKGSLSMALVISLPDTLIYKEQLVMLTFGIVFLSLVVQGTTLRPILKLFKLQTISSDQIEFDKRQGLIISAKAVLTALNSEYHSGMITSSVYQNLKEQYEFTIENAEHSLTRLQTKNPNLADSHLQNAYFQMLTLQRTVIQNAYTQNIICEDAAVDLMNNFDTQMATISWTRNEDR